MRKSHLRIPAQVVLNRFRRNAQLTKDTPSLCTNRAFGRRLRCLCQTTRKIFNCPVASRRFDASVEANPSVESARMR